MSQRVVVTGLGVIGPLGNDVVSCWRHLLEGRSGIGPIQAFDTSGYQVHTGAEAHDFATPDRTRRALELARAAATEALAHARLDPAGLEPWTVGIALGTTAGETDAFEALVDRGDEAPAALADRAVPSHLAADLAAHWGFAGPNLLLPTACSAGNYAIGHAWDLLRTGAIQVMLAGGTDPFSCNAFTGFHQLGNLAREHPRPFSAGREGLTLAEGAAMLVLETLEHAQGRGAPLLAEVLGFGLSCDAYHRAAPDPEGLGATRAMQAALAEAGLGPDAIDHVSAHGTGTELNDRVETLALYRVFGERARSLPVVALKGALGHALGAASALEAIAAVLSLRDQVLPPTLHHAGDDPDCQLDLGDGRARPCALRVVMSNSYAFGGNNASLILGLPPQEAPCGR